MNKPTPIGKKTFAEYEKEVKEFKEYNLSSQRVELGIAKDLASANKKSQGIIKQTTKIVEKIEKAFGAYNTAWEKTRSQVQVIEKQISLNQSIIKEAGSAAKELGVDVNDIKGVNTLESINKELSVEINGLKYPSIR
jgi:predicted  nucleic acid-binding Zn-ribbon protein